jgi:hypothetical protein
MMLLKILDNYKIEGKGIKETPTNSLSKGLPGIISPYI